MDAVNTWLALAVAVLAVLGGIAAMLRGALRTLDQHIDARLARHFDLQVKPQFEANAAQFAAIAARFDQQGARFDQQDLRIGQQGDDLRAHIDRQGAELGARIDRQGAELGARIDRLETKVDHIVEVVDLRLKPLEEDMALIKGHLLGSPAA